MTKALLIIDVQKGFLKGHEELPERIAGVARHFLRNHDKVVAVQHIDENEGSPIEFGTDGANIPDILTDTADIFIQKKTPVAFKDTELDGYLKKHKIKELFIVGFNMEFCILFTAVAAFDRGYDVTVIEDLCGTENNGSTYGMNDLEIEKFVGTVLDRSDVVQNKRLDETEFKDD
ncbi:Peroxyureidoacrylate/ureidoacrylate amidohydrolase RutB [Jeotgalicoccus saudimassiliensis]|uniref:Peroxyureidoacrylate/ureidoacrylate amidohydrolase RutB n=1 Tax=Jeotgalicoccus saudimassiliensis TaxID=1461582 RepID=A0A078M8D7_9STAP|nr:isochorismatase family protein [Jeotgalicoccus saudimassiliensis]CEA00946.1 Peroxyureidoacrylate/ureidoacrylate amidohydrolase RutB [Jeotgalicoccus saudimassiliensis]